MDSTNSQESSQSDKAQKEAMVLQAFIALDDIFVIELSSALDMVHVWLDKPRQLVGDGKSLERAKQWAVNHARKHLANKTGLIPHLDVWNLAWERFKIYSDFTTKILPFRWHTDDPVPAWHILPEPELGPCPQWDEFCHRLSDPGAFCAWVWALFANVPSRQILILLGNGSDGKTTVLNVLREMIGMKASVEFGQYKIDNPTGFTMSQLYRKRFCVVPDCTEKKILSNPVVRSISGREYVTADIKYGSPVDFQLNAMICVSTNSQPHIDDSMAERTRLLPISVAPIEGEMRDASVPDRLKEEFAFFLFKCQQAFSERCFDGVTIEVNIRTKEIVEGCVGESLTEMNDIVEMYFDTDPTAKMSNKIMNKVLLELWNRKSVDVSNHSNFKSFRAIFISHLQKVFSVEKCTVRVGKNVLWGYRGINPKKGMRLDVGRFEGTDWQGKTYSLDSD